MSSRALFYVRVRAGISPNLPPNGSTHIKCDELNSRQAPYTLLIVAKQDLKGSIVHVAGTLRIGDITILLRTRMWVG